MIDLEEFRLLKQSIRERHANVLAEWNDVTNKSQENVEEFKPIRQHSRWKELMEEKEEIVGEQEQTNDVFGPGFIPSESTVRNDYSQRYIDTNQIEFPGNSVKNPEKQTRFEEYPKLQNLIKLKSNLLNQISIRPTYLRCDLLNSIKPFAASSRESDQESTLNNTFHLSSLLPVKYDVVIIDPPLEAYEWESLPSSSKSGKVQNTIWTWEQLAALPIPTIMAKESFIFFWVGSGASDGLERGREVLMKWGFRRCEDIVWVRTNSHERPKPQYATSSTFNRTVEHCLMGIRGTVRRSTDIGFVHCNIDTDVIIWPGETTTGADAETRNSSAALPIDTRSKPPEMMDLIENFCLGTRRLELFGRNRNLRRGWLTVGLDVGPDQPGWDEASIGKNACSAKTLDEEDSNHSEMHIPIAYEKARYDSSFHVDRAGCTLADRSNLVPFDEAIDDLRPKSPRSSAQERREYPSNAARSDQTMANMNTYPTGGVLYPTGGGGGTVYPSQMASFLPTQQVMDTLSVGFNSYPQQTNPPGLASTTNPGGAGLSGLGAGGKSVVSVPSGSELLSGAQASVMLGQGQRPTNANSGPVGLSRRTRR